MTLEELRRKRLALKDRAHALVEAHKGDKWGDAQEQEFSAILHDIGLLDVEIAGYQNLINAATPGGGQAISRGPFGTFGEQLRAVARACAPGGRVDERLHQVANSAGLEEGTPSDGGYLVQSDFSEQLLNKAIGESLASRCNRIPISAGANSIKLPGVDETSRANGSRWGGVQSYWEGEGQQFTGSRPKFRNIKLELNKLTGLCYTTNELLEDFQALGTVIQQAFQDEFGFRLNDAIIRGTGAGQPLGILNSPCLVTASKEAGQAAGTVVWENIVQMWTRMPARNRINAVWLINQDIEPSLYSMSLAIGTGGVPVYMPAGGASAMPYSTLFTRPVIPVEQAETLGTAGDIILADLSQYLLADKGGLKTAVSVHLRFDFDESAFRFVYRCDGMPAWAAPLTPYKGANTLSPFVVLEDR